MKRVLVVDDEAAILELLCAVLASHHQVTTWRPVDEASLAECARLVREHSPDVLIVDWTMPVSARAVVECVRAARPDVRVVVHTAEALTSADLEPLGAATVLRKPCPIERVLAAAAAEGGLNA